VPVPVPGMKAVNERWQRALGQLASNQAALFTGTDLDPQAVIRRMEKLVARVENLATEAPVTTGSHLSATEQLAARLRQALASNAMGGRHTDEQKHRATADAVRDAQAAWQRLPPVGLPEARGLETRFREACRRLQGGHDRRPHQPREVARPSHPHVTETQPRKDEPRREVATV
jgi:hypothetical protein